MSISAVAAGLFGRRSITYETRTSQFCNQATQPPGASLDYTLSSGRNFEQVSERPGHWQRTGANTSERLVECAPREVALRQRAGMASGNPSNQ